MCAAEAACLTCTGPDTPVTYCELSYLRALLPPVRPGRAYDGLMIKVVGVIKPVEKKEIRAEGDSYEEAHGALEAMVPEGWALQSILVER